MDYSNESNNGIERNIQRLEMRKCAYCGKEFEWSSKIPTQKYCCKECGQLANKKQKFKKEIQEIRKCAYCGKEFEWSSKNPGKKYCSKECCVLANKPDNHKEEKTEIRKCAYCGKEFEWSSKNPGKKYCSKECCVLANKPDNYKEEKIEIRKCAHCGKKFEWHSKKSSQKYCGKECAIQATKNRNKKFGGSIYLEELYCVVEANVRNLINRSFEKGETFNGQDLDFWNLGAIPEKTRELVLKRDHYECQICKRKDSLHIHHIIKRSEGGSHDPENLVTLCVSCHRHIETRNIEHAIAKCYKNAKLYYNSDGMKESVYDKKIEISEDELRIKIQKIFERINDINNGEYNELLIKLDNVLDKLKW